MSIWRSNYSVQAETEAKDDDEETTKDEETAQEIIEKEKQGSISREFPSEWINSTLGEIEDATKKGDRKAQKAKNLLKDKRFDKKDNRK